MIYNEYFASMNTGGGFEGHFDNVFSPHKLIALYIIKGGAGTGKSGAMKKIAEYFEGRGHSIERFLCSSDTDSLDGVIVDSKVAVIDGTSPHIKDPDYFGAVDEIINFGTALNEDALRLNRKTIIELVEKKKDAYRKGYAFLSAASQIKKEQAEIASKNLNYEKMQGAIDRFIKQNGVIENNIPEELRLIYSISSKGAIWLDTFEKNSEKICTITNAHGCEGIFLNAFAESLRKIDVGFIKSLSPFVKNEINGIFIPDKRISVVLGRGEETTYNPKYKIFNLERFLDKMNICENRAKLRFAKKCSEALIESSAESFADAKKYHEALEKIYSSAVDFNKVDKMIETLIIKIGKDLFGTY